MLGALKKLGTIREELVRAASTRAWRQHHVLPVAKACETFAHASRLERSAPKVHR